MMNRQLCTWSLALILCLSVIAHGQPTTKPAPAQSETVMGQVNYELLRELAVAGRPAGLQYGDRGEVVVVYR